MDQKNTIIKRRAMTSENARMVRQRGHDAEKEFACIIGGKTHGSGKKKDVIDKRGDIHSVKSGEKKWQIFLYGYNRLMTDIDFQGSNFLRDCLNCFPSSRDKYLLNKIKFKELLTIAMKNLSKYLEDTDVAFEAHRAIGSCYYASDDFENAIKFHSKSLSFASDEM